MKKFIYKFLIIVLAIGMLTPTWLVKVFSPISAEAAGTLLTQIVDDSSASGFAVSPLVSGNGKTGWYLGWSEQGYDNEVSFINSADNQGTPDAKATWTPTNIATGNVKVYLSWTTYSNRATNAKYKIFDKDGEKEVIKINQQKLADQATFGSAGQGSGWYYAGTYSFNNKGTAKVELVNKNADGYVIADAVKFAIDQNPQPESKFSQPLNGNYVNNANVLANGGIKVLWSAAVDADSNDSVIYKVRLYTADPTDNPNSGIREYHGSNLSAIFPLSSDLIDGQYWLTIRVISNDGEGIHGHSLYNHQTDEISFILDTTAPERPTANPVGSTYYSNQNVALVANVSGEIRYTVNGSTPGKASTLYGAPILISQSLTLEAIAYDLAGNSSSILNESYNIIGPAISSESVSGATTTSATITWITDHLSTSRVVYDTVSHASIGSAPNYGYALSTAEDAILVLNHSVTITGLTPGTTYYYRTISHGSPETVSVSESAFSTLDLPQTTLAVATTTSRVSSPSPVAITPTTPSAITPETPTTPQGEQGEIRGTEANNQESENINWTPWIILFILIILAGAATGGYFYWFGAEDDEEIVSKEVIEKSRKSASGKGSNSKPTKTTVKKNKRW